MTQRPSTLERLKAFVVVELAALAMALALALAPRRGSGELIDLPPDASTYLREVLISFALMNGLMLAMVIAALLYGAVKGRSASTEGEGAETSPTSDP